MVITPNHNKVKKYIRILKLLRYEYKLSDRNKYLVKVDKWFPSSQICHRCGTLHTEMKDLANRKMPKKNDLNRLQKNRDIPFLMLFNSVYAVNCKSVEFLFILVNDDGIFFAVILVKIIFFDKSNVFIDNIYISSVNDRLINIC